MEDIKLEVTKEDLFGILKESLGKMIDNSVQKNKEHINASLDNYFMKGFFKDKISQFDEGLDWAVEHVFREGLEKAIKDLNFKEIVAEKAKELLSDQDFITKIATQKVRASLGLPIE